MKNLVFKYALQNAIFYNGKADPGAVLGKVMAEQPHLRKKVQEVRKEIEQAVRQVNSVPLEQQKVWLESLAPKLLVKEAKAKEGLPELPGAKKGKVVTRFAPSPTGPLNISHVLRAVMVNYLYAKKYKGKFILRLEDTDASKIAKEYYDMIREDLSSIGVKPNLTVIQSHRLERYYLYAARLIRKGKIFACFCSGERFRELSAKKKPCPHQKAKPRENLKIWKDALAGKYKEGEVVFSKELPGDSVEDVLSYVEYEPKLLVNRFRQLVEGALRKKLITVQERNAALQAYETGMRGYTYFED